MVGCWPTSRNVLWPLPSPHSPQKDEPFGVGVGLAFSLMRRTSTMLSLRPALWPRSWPGSFCRTELQKMNPPVFSGATQGTKWLEQSLDLHGKHQSTNLGSVRSETAQGWLAKDVLKSQGFAETWVLQSQSARSSCRMLVVSCRHGAPCVTLRGLGNPGSPPQSCFLPKKTKLSESRFAPPFDPSGWPKEGLLLGGFLRENLSEIYLDWLGLFETHGHHIPSFGQWSAGKLEPSCLDPFGFVAQPFGFVWF